MDHMDKPWDLRVDFNTCPGPDLVYGNARHARAGIVVRQGSVLTVGDDDWGVVRAEIIELDETTGSFTARLLGDIVPVDESAAGVTG